ncbi:putative quinol monooxygenase [Trinickia fusca]|uniref:Antibiotic biosynthesis monooxygenase n=1 Tax=Trinickia fusca TaxID=2419777 RepID=A0A494XQS5_9BURK|nr:putative quinol monooxygenase [Trinickia fusca]RKP50484.1 antibiotic biosynthesis monooxygenase [Trinickia fusca]
MTNERQQLTLIAHLQAKPGSEEELGRRLLKLVEPSRSEAGCINYDVHRSNDDPAQWVMYENWRSNADLDAHFAQPYLVEFVKDSADLLAKDMDIELLSMHSAHVAPKR